MRQPHDCPAEERKVYTLCPSFLMTDGSVTVEDFATASNHTAVYYVVSFSDLNSSELISSCASDSSNIHVKPKQIQKASSLRRTLNNIKGTTAIQLVNSPAFHKGTNKKNRLTQRFWLFQIVRLSDRWGGHKATAVHGCLSLQGSTPLLSW